MKNDTLFKEYITAISEIHDRTISKTSARIYWETLSEYSDQQCIRAFELAIKTLKFFPKPSDLIELIPGEAIRIEDRALVVADKIVSHLQIYGSSKYPDLTGDPIAANLMARRWPYKKWAANILESEIKWWVKEFCEAYSAHSESDTPMIEAPEDVLKLASGMFEKIEA